jgi:hypothetical protein
MVATGLFEVNSLDATEEFSSLLDNAIMLSYAWVFAETGFIAGRLFFSAIISWGFFCAFLAVGLAISMRFKQVSHRMVEELWHPHRAKHVR